MTQIDELKILIREETTPYFSDEELNYYLNANDNDVKRTAYQCLILKSENTTVSVSGLNTADSSSYFKRLASQFKPNNTGILK